MLTYIKIKGFKSFDDFEMEFSPFTVIAGANASGKSNLFDVFKLLAELTQHDFQTVFNNQRGNFIELFTNYGYSKDGLDNNAAKEISLVVEMLIDKSITDDWGRTASLKYTRLRYELTLQRQTNELGFEEVILKNECLLPIKFAEDKWIKNIPVKDRETWRPSVKTGKRNTSYIGTEVENDIVTVYIPQDGQGGKKRYPLSNKANRTILSSIDTVEFPHVFAAKKEMQKWNFLELNARVLAEPTKKQGGITMLGLQGENLAGVLFRIKKESNYNLVEISRKVQKLLPNFVTVDVIDDEANKQYLIKLIDADKKEFSSRVLSEGTLRILALCVIEYDDKHTGLLCFEEPENGIHPFRMNAIVAQLKSLCVDFSDNESALRQVIVNTHSPVLLSSLYPYLSLPELSVWYLKTVSRVGKGLKIIVTVPDKLVIKSTQTTMDSSRLTLQTIIKYLETVDSEQFKTSNS